MAELVAGKTCAWQGIQSGKIKEAYLSHSFSYAAGYFEEI